MWNLNVLSSGRCEEGSCATDKHTGISLNLCSLSNESLKNIADWIQEMEDFIEYMKSTFPCSLI
jgi:hypothetical protein